MASRLQLFLFALLVLTTGIIIGLLVYPHFEGGQPAAGQPEQKAPLSQGTYSAKANILAVSSGGTGVMSQAEVEIIDGKGRVLFSVNPFVEPDTQYSAETARKVAEDFTGKSLENRDVIYTITAGESKLVGGPSAGAALTLATIAAIEKKPIREDFAMTGTIQENGAIGQIGGVIEKGTAAAQNGIKLFLVPEGQSKGIVYERKTAEKKGRGFVLQRVYYEPVEFDLNKALFEEYGMEVIEVGTIKEAAQYAFK
ncbi:MAG: S16 family serine protease [Candidatus Diapherotrites archaeon]